MESVGANKKSKSPLDGKLNICLPDWKKNPSFKNKLCVLPFNFQDKKIISGGQSKDAVVVTLLFGPCSVVI